MSKNNATVIVTSVSATTTGSWLKSDWKFDSVMERCYAGTQPSGGQTLIQVALSVEDTPTYIFTVATVTSTSFDGTLHGPWPQFRFVTTGASSGGTKIGVVY